MKAIGLLDRLPVIGHLLRRQATIDMLAITLLRTSASAEDAYQAARQSMRDARVRRDWHAERTFANVGVRIAEVSGRAIGKGASPRYGEPTHRIEGERIIRSRTPATTV